MVHGDAFLQYDTQGGPRGDDQLGSINWGMLMAMRQLAGGTLHLHAMASAEPLTIGAQGYPLLLQTGETYQGQPLHDRQHPHDLLMESRRCTSVRVGHPGAVMAPMSLRWASPRSDRWHTCTGLPR